MLDIDHNEWLTATEFLDDDDRPDKTQSLWATWDGHTTYLGWEGGWWNTEGTLWAYYDLLTGGTTSPVTGSVSLPFDADVTVQVIFRLMSITHVGDRLRAKIRAY